MRNVRTTIFLLGVIGTAILLLGTAYPAASWTTLYKPIPEWARTIIYGIDGDRIVGFCWEDSGWHGFLYDGASWTTLDMPGAMWTMAWGIDGDKIVGCYYTEDPPEIHGFLYDGARFKSIEKL